MACIQIMGSQYGLTLNFAEIDLLPIRVDCEIRDNEGNLLPSRNSIIYLGSLLTSDGLIASERGRRIDLASQEFKNLKQAWNHSKLSRKEKNQIFDSCIVSKLVYGIHTSWLNAAARRKLDGFQYRYLR